MENFIFCALLIGWFLQIFQPNYFQYHFICIIYLKSVYSEITEWTS